MGTGSAGYSRVRCCYAAAVSAKRIAIGITMVVVAGSAWYLGSPLFLNKTVDENLPESSGLTREEKAMIDTMESLTPEEVEAMPEEERMEAKKNMEELGQKMPDKVMEEPMQGETQPVVLVSGNFTDADSFHRGSGKATVYVYPDGRRILRFEDFEVTNGPALSVYLVNGTGGNVEGGYVNLGKLRGNIGNQNYEIPVDADLETYHSVVIWCVPFRVTFAVASLQ